MLRARFDELFFLLHAIVHFTPTKHLPVIMVESCNCNSLVPSRRFIQAVMICRSQIEFWYVQGVATNDVAGASVLRSTKYTSSLSSCMRATPQHHYTRVSHLACSCLSIAARCAASPRRSYSHTPRLYPWMKRARVQTSSAQPCGHHRLTGRSKFRKAQ